MSRKLQISVLLGLMFVFVIGILGVEASNPNQEATPTPRPPNTATVTPNSRPPGQGDDPDSGSALDKSIRGSVYIDVNSDGVCVNSGVAGEGPVQYINIDFISSAGEKLVTLQSGEDGTYGMVGAGDSYWEVKADPDNTWVVTSQNPLYVPIGDDNPVQTGVDFCVQKVDTYAPPVNLPASGTVPALLPEAGAAQTSGNAALLLLAITGMGLILLGAGLKLRERATARQR